MHKALKTIVKILMAAIFVVVLTVFFGEMYLKGKIENLLKNRLPESVNLTYSDLQLSLMRDFLEIQNLEFTRIGEISNKTNLEIKVKSLTVDNINYWNYLFGDTIQIEDLKISEPIIAYYHNKQVHKEGYSAEKVIQLNESVSISHFKISNGSLAIYDFVTDSIKTNIKGFNLLLEEMTLNTETQKEMIPVKVGSYNLELDSLFFKLNNYEDLTTGKSKFSNTSSTLKNIKLKTKYSKKELSKIISVERDHYNLEVDSVSLYKMDLGYIKDKVFFVKIPKAVFYEPVFEVYRDKLVADDPKIKSLYGKMLRHLDFKLSMDTIKVKNANIKYSEKVREDRSAGEIVFSNFNADIENLGNTYSSPNETILRVDTNFMEHAPLHVMWKFDVNNTQDEFLFQAEMGKLNADQLNKFTQPNFNKRFEGELDKTYFTIFGNSEKSQIDFKVKYDFFDIVALKKNGQEKNRFLSDIFNIFITKSSKKGTDGFVEVTRHDIQRNKTKSVFNYIWINTRAGLVKAMTIE